MPKIFSDIKINVICDILVISVVQSLLYPTFFSWNVTKRNSHFICNIHFTQWKTQLKDALKPIALKVQEKMIRNWYEQNLQNQGNKLG